MCSSCSSLFDSESKYVVDSTYSRYTCRSCGTVNKTYFYDLRRVITARDGYCFVCSDWDQMEICVGAAVSGDKTLVKILEGKKTDPNNPAYDIHRVTASTFYGCDPKDVSAEQRQGMKMVNFGALYGIAPKGLRKQLIQSGVNCTLEEAEQKLDAFFTTYPGLKEWFNKCSAILSQKRMITHPWGRIRHIMPDSDTNEILSATNFVIQGWCASIMKDCINKLSNKFEDTDCRVVLCIHDEIIVEAPIDKASWVADLLNSYMNITIKDKAEVLLTATPECKFNLSKGAKSYTVDELEETFLCKKE